MSGYVRFAIALALLMTCVGCRADRDAVVVAEVGPVFVDVESPAPVRHTFEVSNRSPHAVTVMRMRTSCNCAKAELSTRELPPGHTGRLTLSYRPERLSGADSVYADLFFSDGTVKRFELRVTWFPRLHVPRHELSLLVPLAEQRTTRLQCRLFAPDREKLPTFDSVRCDDGLACELVSHEDRPAGVGAWERIYEFRVLAGPADSPGRRNGTISLMFRDGDGRPIEGSVHVHWTVPPVLRCDPPVATLDLHGRATIRVKAEDNTDFEIIAVTFDPPEAARWLTATVGRDKRSVLLKATESSADHGPQRAHHCTLRLRTNHPKQPVVDLLVLSYDVR